MHLILTGATGLVGSGVLHYMLTTPSITKISILSRRPVPMAEGHAKAHTIIHKDYETYPSELMAQLKDADGCVWAQGISQTKVGKEEYIEITHTYPLSFARALSSTTSPKPIPFIYVSGAGATTNPGMFTPIFGVTKGRTEADLLALSKDTTFSNLRPFSVRPAGVDAGAHEEILGYVPKKEGMERVMISTLLPVVKVVMPSFLTPTRGLGAVLSKMAMGNGEALTGTGVEAEGRTVNNVRILEMAKEWQE
ncbi:Protein FMP52 [Lachnellula suecica]|uniref:Protein FMP52 n=1 Tax=Lachnellula suecica TaxID=602035 RepID=A0A8T9C4V0_9HELO|nr:Protein FMP52 [Lachnellula suecica]